MRKRRFNSYNLETGCSVEATLEVIGGKWKGVILYHLTTSGTLRFSELQRLKPDLSPRILTAQLRELEADGVVSRKVYAVVPPKVEYSLTDAGKSLKPLILAMQRWGDEHLVRTDAPLGRKPVSSKTNRTDAVSNLHS
jgi:DNA-binding HxlR family transcriptional regulator